MSNTQSPPKLAKRLLLILGIWLGFALVLISLVGPILSWPLTDESTYVLQARHMAEGLLPYRDFYDFVTPGSQWIGSVFIRLNGFSLVSLRLLVLVAWILELLMIYTMGKNHLPKVWLGLFVGFLWLTDSRYPVFQHHLWSGLTALASVFMAWRYLQSLYDGKAQPLFISLAGLLCAATFWITQSLGICMAMAFGVYSLLHCFLQEREEKGAHYLQVAPKAVLTRWATTWGAWGILSWLAFHALCIGILYSLGIWDDFLRDTCQWLAGGHYNNTSILGYFPTFHKEFLDTIRPFLDGVKMPAALLFIFRFPIAFHLFLIGLLPVIGILGVGYLLPNRFHYRLLQRQDDELLLFWICATAMIISTMSYSTSMHITSNGGLALFLGVVAIYQFFNWKCFQKPRWEKSLIVITSMYCLMLFFGAITASVMDVLLGSWITSNRAIPEPLIYNEANTSVFDSTSNLS